MISEDLILKIKEENDIVDVISEWINLKRSGRNYIGLCPFHGEKTPSFTVSRDKQIFKCFGCGEAGNVFSFIMKYKKLSFPEAVKFLANRVSIDIEESKESSINQNKRKNLYKINVCAARYFFNNLNKNSLAKNYFLKREISSKTLVKFGLGYALDDWHGLLNYLKSKGYTELDMLNAGLIIKGKNNSYYDRFRNRVIFPVFDYKGNVIGFGGRVLDDSKPKYLNSPETYIFKKGTNLYGLNFVLKNLNFDYIIIVEGYMDCISLHQNGITNVVASLGTALTINQARLLKRYTKKIIISYDADTAGQTATLRGLDILKKEGLEVKVLMIPDGKDPDEFIKKHGKDGFIKLVQNSLPLIEYKLIMEGNGINFKDKEMIIKYTNKIIPILSKINPIEREIYIKKLSQKLEIREDTLYDMVNRYNNKNLKNETNYDSLEKSSEKLYLEPAYVKAERVVLNTLLNCKESIKYIFDSLKPEDMIIEVHKNIYEFILKNSDLSCQELIKKLEIIYVDNSKEFVKILDIKSLEEDTYKSVIKDCIIQIKKFKLEESKANIMKQIKECELEGKLDKSIKLAKQLIDIQREISNI